MEPENFEIVAPRRHIIDDVVEEINVDQNNIVEDVAEEINIVQNNIVENPEIMEHETNFENIDDVPEENLHQRMASAIISAWFNDTLEEYTENEPVETNIDVQEEFENIQNVLNSRTLEASSISQSEAVQ